ncbi:ATP-NAD kinase-like domain-containing protein [Xylaria venustula]|nr:ATP-NAD kinase-like domain-containing protein [Xylaria venustula]
MAADDPTSQDAATLPSPEQVVVILKKEFTRTEQTYEVLSLEQTEKDGKPSFVLRRSSYAENNKGLQDLWDEFGITHPPVHLQPGSQRRLHVIVSTNSGTGLSTQVYENVLAPLLETFGLTAATSDEPEQGSYHLLITQNAESVKEFSKDFTVRHQGEANVEHTIVLLSGDGGVIDLLNGYASSTESADSTTNLPIIAILPLGTGNALFHSLHKRVKSPPTTTNLVQGLRTLLRGKAAPLPSFKVTFPEGSRTITYSETSEPASTGIYSTTDSISSLGEQTEYVTHLYGVVVASYGFHSQLVWESDTPEYRKHGAQRFHMVAEQLLKEGHAYRATVEIGRSSSTTADEASFEKLDRDEHAYILATPVSNLEKTFCISPASEPLDGQLRLVHFGPVDGAKTMEIMMAAYDGGKHIGIDGVGYEEINELRITTHEEDARWRKICIDGTIVEIPAGGRIVVSKEARRHLKVLADGSTSNNAS